MPFSGASATRHEIEYARIADHTPHIVVSKTLDKAAWKRTQIVRELDAIWKLKQPPGKDMHVVGSATLVSNMIGVIPVE